ncbi:S8 family serine peptidase [Lacihabitans soyangensis]|uniref:Peptidase S8 n=1 Tax=Lacihabitans soyangensis TaxID=869394 RepID=A0AAE3H0X8_9BACT|nr:S8 family serine peptidase [Lacihabitans soyangensis]MCP9762708.1 peptidase S8 [Lacihabitans soyangensis]
MKYWLGLFFTVLFWFNALSQKKLTEFSEGEIYIRVKPQFGKMIKSTTKALNVATEAPFISNTIATSNISKIEKPFSNLKNRDLNNIIRLKLKDSDKIDDIIDQLKQDGYYVYVEKVPIRKIISAPNDTDFGSQWSLTKIKADQAWDVNPGGNPVVVAVVDNAIETNHPDLAANMVAGKDMSSLADTDPNPPNASFSHGTHVAGIVSAVTNNALGIASAGNNKVKIMPIKATPDNGSFNSIYYGFEGIRWAVDNGAKIVSLSWGGPGFSQAEQDVIDYAYNRGVMVVAAAGNDNNDELSYPAAYNHVISVASLDINDARSSFSSYGNTVDISAPGRGILSTIPFGTYASFSGTSMATPLVSSCLAYIWSCFPSLTMAQLENVLKSTADDISSVNPSFVGQLGSGRVNLLNAVACLNENLASVSLSVSPSRYFCVGDSAIISTPLVAGTNYVWRRNGVILPDTDNSFTATQDGNYTLTVSKGFCVKTVESKPVVYNVTQTQTPSVNNLEDRYCSAKLDTLVATSPACSFPDFYQKIYSGPTVGFDGFEQSGSDITVNMTDAIGLIDSLEVTISWHKKDGGGATSCSTADGGGVPFNEEVGFKLLSPSGQLYDLIAEGTYARGTASSGLVTMVFKNNAPIVGISPVSGNFSPRTSFSTLVGEFPNGIWKLLPVDNSLLDPLCVSGFGIKIYTNAHLAVQSTTWWDASVGGNLLSNSEQLVRSNLPLGSNYYYAQSQCTGLCPSPRQKAEIFVKSTPEIFGFPFENVSITVPQADEIANSTNIQFSKNTQNQFSVTGTNQNNQAFSYQISAIAPHVSPVSVCDSVDFVLIATGCSGPVLWSNGETNAGIIIQNLKTNLSITAVCLQNWNCPVPPPTDFNFVRATEDKLVNGVIMANSSQNIFAKDLTSVQKIQPVSNVLYQASESILLSPGFVAEKGNVFKAQIGNCF